MATRMGSVRLSSSSRASRSLCTVNTHTKPDNKSTISRVSRSLVPLVSLGASNLLIELLDQSVDDRSSWHTAQRNAVEDACP